MSDRHVLATTNSAKAAEIIVAAVMEDFPVESIGRVVTFIAGVGWVEQITVDADDYDRWVLQS